MRTIVKGVAVICVIGASLAVPARAEACYTLTVLVSFSYDYSEVAASTNLQFDGWTCTQYVVSEVKAKVTLETPSEILPEEYELGYWQALATTSDSYGEHGWGWYTASGHGEIKVDWPFSETVPTDTDYDWLAVPGPPSIELDGPTSVAQYGGATVTASVDPWYWAQHIDWQGCTPVSGYPSTPACSVDTNSVGQKTITASIGEGTWEIASDSWYVQVQ